MSHRTAITRRALSRPVRWLLEHDHIVGDVLDYGCGRGTDAQLLGAAGYDPHYQPNLPEGVFDTILCSFVLNVVNVTTRRRILTNIRQLLAPQGKAYIAVRRDLKRSYRTTRGWTQYRVQLPLPIVHETRDYAIYQVEAPGV